MIPRTIDEHIREIERINRKMIKLNIFMALLNAALSILLIARLLKLI